MGSSPDRAETLIYAQLGWIIVHVVLTRGGKLMSETFGIQALTGGTMALGFGIAVLIGGLGSIEGAVAAALLIGFTETMAAGYGDDLHLLGQEWQNAYTFVLMILILLWRPTGLFGGRGRLQETLQ